MSCITESFVYKLLSRLDISKSTRLDGIGPRLLKLSSSFITRSITYIAQACIPKGYFPESWKQANVNPLYKGGAKEEINNYRPISILHTVSKLPVEFIQKNLIEFLNKYDVLHQSQSGFRSGHSTEIALTLMAERWLKAINDGNIVATIMIDFRKAFDLVDHSLLIKKLGVYKCSEHFIKFMDSYLCQRTQVVSIDGTLSRICDIKFGVPQGSVLGPLLFLIFINDLPLVLSEIVHSIDLYADDTTIWDMQSDLETLQSNLQYSLIKLQNWCKQNGMLLNAEKTNIMLITTRQKRIRLHEDLCNLTHNDINLQLTTGDKILGVTVEQNLQWTNHFQYVCKKISSHIWLLSKIHSYLTMEHRSLFYKAYIQPHINYCNIVWGNYQTSKASLKNNFRD